MYLTLSETDDANDDGIVKMMMIRGGKGKRDDYHESQFGLKSLVNDLDTEKCLKSGRKELKTANASLKAYLVLRSA